MFPAPCAVDPVGAATRRPRSRMLRIRRNVGRKRELVRQAGDQWSPLQHHRKMCDKECRGGDPPPGTQMLRIRRNVGRKRELVRQAGDQWSPLQHHRKMCDKECRGGDPPPGTQMLRIRKSQCKYAAHQRLVILSAARSAKSKNLRIFDAVLHVFGAKILRLAHARSG